MRHFCYISVAMIAALFSIGPAAGQGHMRIASAMCEEVSKAAARGGLDAWYGRPMLEGIRFTRDYWRRFREQGDFRGSREDIVFHIEEMSVMAYRSGREETEIFINRNRNVREDVILNYLQQLQEQQYSSCIRHF